jgi:hypothetical protein
MISLFIGMSLNGQTYKIKYLITLKKDETKKILVKYNTITKLLKFRWTLYHNKRLVLFRSYDEEIAQTILAGNPNQDAVRIVLMNSAVGYDRLPYIILHFDKFVYPQRQAVFTLYLFDKYNMVALKFLKQ